MSKPVLNVSAVGYWNTLPYRYLLDNEADRIGVKVTWDIPSVCAQKLRSGEADVGLVPTAVFPRIPGLIQFANCGIAARGPVYSVALFSDYPLNEIKRIHLDFHSQTSVRLVQILAREHWKIHPEFVPSEPGFFHRLEAGEAAVVIGDRAFGLEKSFAYKWDLSEAWMALTGLSFAFAVWAARAETNPEVLASIRDLFHGVEQFIEPSIERYSDPMNLPPNIHSYLTENIIFTFDASIRKGMEKYLDWAASIP